MRLLYNPTTGKIFYAVMFADWPKHADTTQLALSQFNVDEIAANIAFIADIHARVHEIDKSGKGKYFWQGPAPGNIFQVGGWVARPGTYIHTADTQITLATINAASVLSTIAADLALMNGTATLAQTQSVAHDLLTLVRGLLRREFRLD